MLEADDIGQLEKTRAWIEADPASTCGRVYADVEEEMYSASIVLNEGKCILVVDPESKLISCRPYRTGFWISFCCLGRSTND